MDFRSLSVGLLVVELRVGNAKFNVQVRSLLREAGYELVRTLKASGMHTEHEPMHTAIQPLSLNPAQPHHPLPRCTCAALCLASGHH